MSSFRRQLAWTLLLQGSGAAAAAAAVLWIGVALGPVQQGRFNEAKSLVELGAALAMLGMPQALYVLAQQGRLALARARQIAARVALVGVPAGLLLGMLVLAPGHAAVALAMAVAVALAALQGQWRALALLSPSSTGFNLATAAPQWAALLLAGAVVAAGGVSATVLVLGLSLAWALGCAVAWQALPAAGAPATGAAVSVAGLARFGAATWLTASLAAAAIVLVQQWARTAGGPVDLGRVSMAVMLAQMPLVPLNYAVPLLLRRRLQSAHPADPWRLAPWVMLPMLALATLAFGAGAWRGDLGLGEGYAGLHVLLAWLLVAGAADAASRLWAVEAQARTRPWQTSVAEAVRVGVLLAGPASDTWLGAQGAAEGLVRWVVVAAVLSAVVLWLLGRQR